MAKKSATTKKAPAAKSKKKLPPTPTAPVAAPKAPRAKGGAATKPTIDNEAIGHAAGDVWGALHGQGWRTLAAVKKDVDRPADLTLLAIGWLAREGKLDFAASGRSVKVSLK